LIPVLGVAGVDVGPEETVGCPAVAKDAGQSAPREGVCERGARSRAAEEAESWPDPSPRRMRTGNLSSSVFIWRYLPPQAESVETIGGQRKFEHAATTTRRSRASPNA